MQNFLKINKQVYPSIFDIIVQKNSKTFWPLNLVKMDTTTFKVTSKDVFTTLKAKKAKQEIKATQIMKIH